MNPGRELDALVAEKVMGWKWVGHNWHTSPAHKTRTIIEDGRKRTESYDSWEDKGPHKVLISPSGREFYFCGCDKGESIYDLPAYSTDIADAWEVVEKLGLLELGRSDHLDDEGEQMARAYRCTITPSAYAEAPTAPHAICLAALKAVGWEGK